MQATQHQEPMVLMKQSEYNALIARVIALEVREAVVQAVRDGLSQAIKEARP